MSQNVDEDEVVSEYLTTPLDYYLRGQLANRPSEYDDTTHNPDLFNIFTRDTRELHNKFC
ncbi:unnamed protein product [Brugia pahangi]|uniref:Mediator of RNA polymerase II transcription subunit 7 n=1 Tax=Brugia pahangi TaxID=6280 RepID=A0A0N4TA64_BRUPA|nr:unnamed protein product [Brugia pahangi]